MNTRVLFLLVLICGGSACSQKVKLDTYRDIEIASEAISFCERQYRRLTDAELDQEIDHAYVQSSADMLGVVFSRGAALNEDDEPNPEFRPILTCGVLIERGFELVTLGASDLGAKPIYESAEFETHYREFLDTEVHEKIFLKQGSEFVFDKVRVLWKRDAD